MGASGGRRCDEGLIRLFCKDLAGLRASLDFDTAGVLRVDLAAGSPVFLPSSAGGCRAFLAEARSTVASTAGRSFRYCTFPSRPRRLRRCAAVRNSWPTICTQVMPRRKKLGASRRTLAADHQSVCILTNPTLTSCLGTAADHLVLGWGSTQAMLGTLLGGRAVAPL